ncbi:hypothetical protein [Candidatus Phytoplasma gossypii]|uniref:Uncharacterized protein n=1 Tax=Candidatus Phytoplasma gossypii TaxID=2982629 RepID=A0ABT9D1U2_9MOLU|nr:hypothetical protein ['Gossypium sp.' phytoplasma]MDO8057640.1 hypothetical protein ['Gossypium sp.' phytoplasma]
MSKIIIKKTKNPEKNNHHLKINPEFKISPIEKLPLFQKITYLMIILNSFLSCFALYYENKIPWFTTGINNLIILIKLIIPGGK